ncbi:hypothetical protein PSHT_05204 [Puccinia striiformis]|uniref:Uncharacterized protein n=1 Tax=Puccinia striiformis TaxID=27350 RepID=A0A2S4WB71_9BASI|nr:hypothetical protein PSHT_05204 [Puccinia striiformis]
MSIYALVTAVVKKNRSGSSPQQIYLNSFQLVLRKFTAALQINTSYQDKKKDTFKIKIMPANISSATVLDPRTSGLVIEAFASLLQTCQQGNTSCPASDTSQGALPTDRIKARSALLTQLQGQFLPLLKRGLGGLLQTLEPSALRKNPTRNLNDTLKITTTLDHTLNQIITSVKSIATRPITRDRSAHEKDRDSGLVKIFRCHALLDLIRDFIPYEIRQLFYNYQRFIQQFLESRAFDSGTESDEAYPELLTLRAEIIKTTYLSLRDIDNLIRWSTLSDFSILQTNWERREKQINLSLKLLALHTDFKNHSRNHTEDESEDAIIITSSPQLVRLVQSAIPLVKLLRILFNKLLNTPTGRPPFTLEGMSSADVQLLNSHSFKITSYVDAIVVRLVDMHKRRYAVDGDIILLEGLANKVTGAFNAYLVLIGSRLVPLASQPSLHPSENLFDTYFTTLRLPFQNALSLFKTALHHDYLEIQYGI